ncbi:MAG: bifunctional UDP-N-acetylmuramoyl-tripeptide:D-alanyl-D-alanine ligase/alanine racemase [Ferruginibacter sp.]|nr:bifunctional UDP-N-acetylmuramoyl-tripeptide:D-alanyl-D-alanine ligase/alanine racemase [Ferruginibacter sp.]
MYNITQISNIINATLSGKDDGLMIEHILLDSRKLLFPLQSVFFALDGKRWQSSLFIDDLYKQGVRCFVVDENFSDKKINEYAGAAFLQVQDVLHALQLLTAWHRKQYSMPVTGITGSNGKTSVKEWLYQLLQYDYNIIRSPKSYNSQIGVPLSVWQMNNHYNLAIFEAGISLPGEMEKLEKIIAPGIGIITNIGDAHSEGFTSLSQKIHEKLKLFVHSKLLIYGSGNAKLDKEVVEFKKNSAPGLKLFTWGNRQTDTLQVLKTELNSNQSTIQASYKEQVFEFTIPFTDAASVENALTCCCLMLYMNVSTKDIAVRMLQLRPVEMRLQLKQGINNCSVINDSYSADINSLTIALNFLQHQQQHNKRTVILSDILQSGKKSQALYAEVAAMLEQKNINRFIGIGPQISEQQQAFKNIKETSFFNSTNQFKQQFRNQQFSNETILLKGARVFEFEQISHLLEKKRHQTVLEVNLNAITHNLNTYKQKLAPGVKLMAMVKAFSYGSGSFEIANLLQFHRADYLAVAYTDEGVELRKAGISLPLMVMNAEEITFDALVENNLEPELFSFGIMKNFAAYLKNAGITNYPVHIKLDTGMHRLGFTQHDIDALCVLLKDSPVFKIQSVFSHLAASDSVLHDGFTAAQAASFTDSCNKIKTATGYNFIRHIANTSAIHRHPHLQFDMVRLGIGLYGADAVQAIQQQLKNVTTLKTTISQIKKIKKGESVGYNRNAVADKDSVIATVNIGYADGYPRILGNGNGKMLLNGKRVPVIGNVCMDMTMLDITEATAKEADEVIVFGEELPVAELAAMAQTIPYEILTGISQRVKRVYFEE